MSKKLEDRSRAVWGGAKYASIGLEIGLAVGVGAGAGYWLDARYGWSPWGVLIGTFVGIGAAAKALWRITQEIQREAELEERDG